MTATATMTEYPPRLGVFKAIRAVTEDMSKIGMAKRQRNEVQKFNFRGIDDLYNGLSPSLAKHGLVILPSVFERQVTERNTRNGGVMLHVVLIVDYTFLSSEDGSWHTCRAYGEAMDSGDKATNKALAAAYKYMCFQTFCIPIEGSNEDADSETHEIAQPKKAVEAPKKPAGEFFDVDTSQVTRDTILFAIDLCSSEDELRKLWMEQAPNIKKLHAADREAVESVKEDRKASLKGKAA
jgi:ERF superfamily